MDESGATAIGKIKNDDFFDFEFYTFRYSVLLKCDNESCCECASSCGHGAVNVVDDFEDKNGAPIIGYLTILTPEYFYPALNIFVIPPKCPAYVAKEIKSSFKLFFADPPASANYVRKAVEAILTDKKIKRFTTNKKGERQRINLHSRIVLFQSRQPEVAKNLFAIKWLGNEGSHGSEITKNDILDAYEILEFVMDDLYVGHRKLVEKKVAKINKSKKPLHPST